MRLSPLVGRASRWGLVLGWLLLAAATAGAAEPRPVPSAPVQRADGTTVDLASLATSGPWVVISVTAEAPVTVRLLRALEAWTLPIGAGQVVLLVDGTPLQVGRLAAAWESKVPGLQWVADERGEARRALQVRALPTIIGARSGMLEWQIAGVLNDPAMLRSVVGSWLSDAQP